MPELFDALVETFFHILNGFFGGIRQQFQPRFDAQRHAIGVLLDRLGKHVQSGPASALRESRE
jgi:hypothetical protein